MHRLLAAALILGLAGFVQVAVAPPAAACSCAGLDDDQLFGAADAVFVGTVTDREATDDIEGSMGHTVLWRFRVEGVHKGAAHVEQGVVGGVCSPTLDVGGRYLVFASSRPLLPPAIEGATLHTNACSGTRRISAADTPVPFAPPTSPLPGEDGMARLPGTGPGWPLAVALACATGIAGAVIALLVIQLTRRRRRDPTAR